MRRFTSIIAFILLFALAACGGAQPEGGELPTVMSLPTETDTPQPMFTLSSSNLTPSATLAEAQTESLTQTITITPSNTITDTPTRTATATNTAPYVPGLADILAGTARHTTILPPDFLPTHTPTPVGFVASPTSALTIVVTVFGTDIGTSCTDAPSGGFASIFFTNPFIQQQLGCPVPNSVNVGTPAAIQNFQGGQMIWVQGAVNYIYVIYNSGTYQRYVDTWVSGETAPITDPPPAGLFEPVRGFGKVWRENQIVRDTLGWATNEESATSANRQEFTGGTMLHVLHRGDTLVLSGTSGTWQPHAGTY